VTTSQGEVKVKVKVKASEAKVDKTGESISREFSTSKDMYKFSGFRVVLYTTAALIKNLFSEMKQRMQK